MAHGQTTAYTTPVGYVTTECKANSDTIVGVPLRQSAAFAGTITVNPNINNPSGFALLSLSGTPNLSVNAFVNTHYVKFTITSPTPAAGDGQWFIITANTADTITVDLNGGTINAVAGAGIEVIKFWTLGELFDPAVSTTIATTTGNAIVSSTSPNAFGRRTTLLIPNYLGTGINLSSAYSYYILDSAKQWRTQGDATTNMGSFVLWPDSYFIIRHASSVTASTRYTVSGQVELGDFHIQLNTLNSGAQDNFIALPRPVDLTLASLNLGGTDAFMLSESTNAFGRRDQLFVFDNSAVGINKSSSATYFYHGGMWKKAGDGNVNHNNDVISAGAGIRIRKYQTNTGTASWDEKSPY